MGQILDIAPQKVRRWYKDVLSSFRKEEKTTLHQYDIIVKNSETGKTQTVYVPFCIPQNIGKDMCIDEKKIGEEFYTILSNRTTGKLVFMASTTNSSFLLEATKPIETELKSIEIINRDLAGCYRKFCTIAMPDAKQVGDKFHVVKLLMEAGQAVRMEQKRKISSDKRRAHEAHKIKEKARKKACAKKLLKFKKKKFVYNERVLSNTETPSQVLSRSRGLLFKHPEQWTKSQRERANVLFPEFPEIEKSYRLVIDFRNWYSKKNIERNKYDMDRKLHQWYEDVENSGIVEIMNFSSTVERNEEYIVNYFNLNGATNAMAENRNSKIKKFISSNQGTRDRDFFFFRLKKYFA